MMNAAAQPVTTDSVKQERGIDRVLNEKERPLQILLVEDSRTNQLIVTASLEQTGCLVQVVGDGREALHMLRKKTFDLVLMDVFMPKMDGLEATRAIRQNEPSDGRRVPIVGLTATDTPEQRKACLAAGMDECMSKPLNVDRLYDLIAPFIPTLYAGEEHSKMERPNLPDDAPVDLREALRVVDGDVELLRDVIDLFLEEYPDHLAGLEMTLTQQNAGGVERAAHRLKGILGNVGARVAQGLAEQLESMGEKGRLDAWEDVWVELELEITSVIQFFESLDWEREAERAKQFSESEAVV